MSEKISAMTPATDCNNADVIPAVQAGANVKMTRDAFLTAVGVEFLTLTGAGGDSSIVLGVGGQLALAFGSAGGFGLSDETQTYIIAVNPVPFIIQADRLIQINNTTSGASIAIDAGGGDISIITGGGQSVVISYTSLVPAAWAGAPADLANAVDRLASAVSGLLGTGIP
jgi:hypothetical protein